MTVRPFILSAIAAASFAGADAFSGLAHGTNPPDPDYWRNYGVTANVLKHAYTNPSNFAGSYDRGWPILGRNVSVTFDAFLACDTVAHAPKPGRYVVTVPAKMAVLLTVDGIQPTGVGAIIKSISPATAVVNSFNGDQIENSGTEPMRIEFDYPDSPSARRSVNGDLIRPLTTHFLRVRFMWLGEAGSTQSTAECKVFHTSAEADILVGYNYTQEFIDYISGRDTDAPIRLMPMFCPNTTFVETPSDLPPSDKSSREMLTPTLHYSGTRGSTLMRSTSPEEMAEIQFRAQRPIWVSLPPQMQDVTLAAFFQRLHDALTSLHGTSAYSTLVYVEPSNELWNGSFASNYGYLSEIYSTVWPDTGAPALAGNKANAYTVYQMNGAHFGLRAWKAAEQVMGRSRVCRTFGCQVAFYDGGARIMLNYVDPGIISAGARAGALADIVTVAPYFNTYGDLQIATRAAVIAGTATYTSLNLSQYLPAPRGVATPSTVGSSSIMSLTDRLRGKYWVNGDGNGKTWAQWVDAAFRNGLDWNNIACRYFIGLLREDGFTSTRIGIYEINSHDNYGQPGPSTADVMGLECTYAAGVFTPVTPFDPILESGEIVKVLPITGASGSAVSGGFLNVNFKAKVRPDGSVTLHATQADYDNDVAATGGATGNVSLGNSTRMDAMHRAQVEWLLHSAAGAQYIRSVDTMMAACGFEVACWFVDGGYNYSFTNASSGLSVQPWTMADKGLWNAGQGHAAWKSL